MSSYRYGTITNNIKSRKANRYRSVRKRRKEVSKNGRFKKNGSPNL